MPFIAFELDAIRKAGYVAASIGVARAIVSDGLLQLWEHCWREKTDVVQAAHIRGFFGCDAGEALSAFEFLEPAGDAYRVRGATRYLRIRAARSAGGKAASGNLRRGNTPAPSREPSRSSSRAGAPAQAGREPELEPRLSPGSTASSEQRSLKKTSAGDGEPNPPATQSVEKTETERPSPTPADDRPQQLFVHWQQVMGKQRTAFDDKRRAKVKARLRDGYSLDDLKAAVTGCAKTPYNMGENDRGERYDDLELICRDAAHVDRFIANAKQPPKSQNTPPTRPGGSTWIIPKG